MSRMINGFYSNDGSTTIKSTYLSRRCSSPFSISMHSGHRHSSISSADNFLECEQAGEMWNERTQVEQNSVVSSRRQDQQNMSDSV